MALMHQTRLGLLKAASVVSRAHNVVRPLYNAARPILHHRGIDTSIPDKALSTYDGIRRAIGH